MRNVFNLNPSPPANAFRKNYLIKNKYYPLNIYLCLDCKHLQLVNIVNPKILFSNYLYSSGASHVYIDPVAYAFMDGATIDYVNDGFRESFVFNDVFKEQGGSGTCGGCGAATGPGYEPH